MRKAPKPISAKAEASITVIPSFHEADPHGSGVARKLFGLF